MNIHPKNYSVTNTKSQFRFGPGQAGFTIVELMIALTILSIILVLSSAIFIEIGALYSKGVNGATLQNTTRNVVADLSATMEFSSSAPPSCTLTTPPSPPTLASPAVCSLGTTSNPNTDWITGSPVYAYCIGTTRYTFVLGRELGTDAGLSPSASTTHVLWRDTINSNGGCNPVDLNLSIPTDSDTKPGTTGYEMMANHMRLTKFIVVPDPTDSNIYNIEVSTAFGDSDLLNSSQTNCKGGVGEQYCATSDINTIVTRRAPSQ